MLLSDPKTSQFIRESFVATWRMVRPVPKVSIDFGNGKKLERTLAGNTILYVARADGDVVDGFPGVWTPELFVPQADLTLKSLSSREKSDLPRIIPSALASNKAPWLFNRRQVGLAQAFGYGLQNSLSNVATTVTRNGKRSTLSVGRVPVSLSKSGMESSMIGMSGSSGPRGDSKMLFGSSWQDQARRLVDISKYPLAPGYFVSNDGKSLSPNEIVSADAQVNANRVRPIFRQFLASGLPSTHYRDISKITFKEILQIDIEDPYLGLANFGLPGTPNVKN